MYYPLHVHTAKGSVGDSILKEAEYITKAKAMGLDRLAITDHGSMANIYSFYFECIKNDITPIIGCEVYLVNNREDKTEKYSHLVLLSQNMTGFHNLLKIVSDAEINGKYRKPRTDYKMLAQHSEGLIALSACLGGSIPTLILQDQEEDKANEILQEIERFKIIFDNRFYLELQPGTFNEQLIVNEALCELSRKTNTPLVITNDVHYLDEEDWFAHDIHVKIQRKQKFDADLCYPDKVYYLMDEADLRCRLQHTIPADCLEEGIKNAELIAKSCNVKFELKGINMPHVDIPKCFTPDDYLEYLVIQSINQKANRLKNPTAYIDRAFYELDVIKKLGFSEYFLTIKDIIDHAKSEGIYVGPGRGSVCGSVVAYLCGITQVDPIKYNLLFERFLSEYRKGSVPDVDIDFASRRRKEMFTYSINKHGIDKCALVSTFSMRKAKSSLRDVGRVYAIPADVVDTVCKLIPIAYYDEDGEKSVDLSIKDSLKVVPELRAYQEEYPQWFDLSMKLEDLPRATSIHAAGTLIASTPLIESIPLLAKKDEDILATSLNLGDAEAAGMIKYDYLGLATLDVVGDTEKECHFKFDFDNDSLYEDDDVWDLIGSRNLAALFQIASNTYRQRMHRLKPRTIPQLAACLALLRGPCISSGQDEVYMQIVEGKQEVTYVHPFYDDATAHTYGILLYQEQIMQIAVNFGFSLEDGFKLMKAVAKKKIDKIKEYEEEFFKLADEREVPRECTDYIWKIILDAGLYCFNESHAIAYALLCYQSAYLKVHFPVAYMKHALTNVYEKDKEIVETVKEAFRMGIKFDPLDLNQSEWEFTSNDNTRIRIGMCAIKGLGKIAADEIIEKRPFTDMDDFCERITKSKCKKNNIIPGIFAGLFECLGENHTDTYKHFCEIRQEEPQDVIEMKTMKMMFQTNWKMNKLETLFLRTQIMTNPSNGFAPFNLDAQPRQFTCPAYLLKTKKKDTANGKVMFADFSTGGGNLSAIIFGEKLQKGLRGGKLVEVTLRRNEEKYVVVNIT